MNPIPANLTPPAPGRNFSELLGGVRKTQILLGRDDVVYWYLIQLPLHRSAYASLGRVCTLRKVRTIRGCLGVLALMI